MGILARAPVAGCGSPSSNQKSIWLPIKLIGKKVIPKKYNILKKLSSSHNRKKNINQYKATHDVTCWCVRRYSLSMSASFVGIFSRTSSYSHFIYLSTFLHAHERVLYTQQITKTAKAPRRDTAALIGKDLCCPCRMK